MSKVYPVLILIFIVKFDTLKPLTMKIEYSTSGIIKDIKISAYLPGYIKEVEDEFSRDLHQLEHLQVNFKEEYRPFKNDDKIRIQPDGKTAELILHFSRSYKESDYGNQTLEKFIFDMIKESFIWFKKSYLKEFPNEQA